jgi:hypothetical protein
LALSPEKQAEVDAIDAELARRAAAEPSDVSGDVSLQPAGAPAPAPAPAAPPPPATKKAPPDAIVAHLESLPDWTDMPEMRDFSDETLKARLGTAATSADETAQILKEQFPRLDYYRAGPPGSPEAEYVVYRSRDGKPYVWKPGLSASDIPRGIVAGLPAAAIGAVAGPGVIPGMIAGAGGAAVNELIQAKTGGRAELAPVLAGGVVGALAPVAGRVLRGAGAAILGSGVPATVAESQAPEVIGSTIAKAGAGDAGAAADFAAQAAPDPNRLAAATRRGMTDFLDVDHLSPNPGVQTAVQAIKAADPAAKQAEKDAVEALRERGRQVIAEIAGGEDGSALNERVKAGLKKEMEDSRANYKALYAKQDALTPRSVPAPAPATLSLATQVADDISKRRAKEVPQALRQLIRKLTPEQGVEPTRAMLELLRKDIGRAVKKNAGPFKDLEPGIANTLFESIDNDLQNVAEAHGIGAERTAAIDAYKQHLAFRQNAVTALANKAGASLEGSIIPGLGEQASALGAGVPEKFTKVIMSVPEELRPQVADAAMLTTLVKNGKTDIPQFLGWFDSLKRNKASLEAFEKYVRPQMREAIQDVYDVLRPVMDMASRGARGVNAKDILPAQRGAMGFVKQALAVSGAEAAAAGARHLGVPLPPGIAGTLSALLMKNVAGEAPSAVTAALDFIKSAAGRAALNAAGSPQPVSRGLFERIASSPPARRFFEQLGMSSGGAVKWLEKAMIGAGATISSEKTGGYLSPAVKERKHL